MENHSILKGKGHLEITSMIDTESANLLAGSRFAVLSGDIAKLQRALIAFMLDKAEEHGYTEHYLPMVANSKSLTSTGQLPKFSEDLFQLTDDYYLIPTAEVPLTNMYRDQILDMKYISTSSSQLIPAAFDQKQVVTAGILRG